MKRLRFWVGILSIWLIFFFNIERILFKADVNIIRANTYTFVAVVTLITLLIPRLKNLHFAGLLVGATSLFLVSWYQDPSWKRAAFSHFSHHNTVTLLTIIQVNAIILTGLLVRQITYELSEFEAVIAAITFGQIGQRPQPFSEEQSAMYREIKRARRFERPLAVMALKINEEDIRVAPSRIVEEVQKAMMREYTLAGIARVLNDSLKGFDIIAQQGNDFIVVLPEATESAMPRVAQRLKKAIQENMEVTVQIGSANLYDQAMTFERLVDLALENASQDNGRGPVLPPSKAKLKPNHPALTPEA